MVYIGTSLGTIRCFNLNNQFEYDALTNQNLRGNKVTAIDVSRHQPDFLVTGHKQGQVALWDISKQRCLKVVKQCHDSEVVNICVYLSYENKSRVFTISNEDSGPVKLVSFSKGAVKGYNVIQNDYLFKQRLYCTPSLTFRMQHPIYKFPNFDNLIVCAIGSLDEIVLVELDPYIDEMHSFDRPRFCREHVPPYVDFGHG